MSRYLLWVRISTTQTANTIVFAENALAAKQLGEAQYGVGNVLNYTEVIDQKSTHCYSYAKYIRIGDSDETL